MQKKIIKHSELKQIYSKLPKPNFHFADLAQSSKRFAFERFFGQDIMADLLAALFIFGIYDLWFQDNNWGWLRKKGRGWRRRRMIRTTWSIRSSPSSVLQNHQEGINTIRTNHTCTQSDSLYCQWCVWSPVLRHEGRR